jgi:hypothetical protein
VIRNEENLCQAQGKTNSWVDVTKEYKMKKITVLMTGIFCVFLSSAQVNIENQAAKIITLVERNVTTDGRKPSRLQEYFIYDINLDSNGKILNVDVLRLDSSFYTDEIKKVVPLIKKNWIAIKSPIAKVMIPVLINNNDRIDEEVEHNMSVATIAAFFMSAFKNNSDPKIFVSRMAIIEAFD